MPRKTRRKELGMPKVQVPSRVHHSLLTLNWHKTTQFHHLELVYIASCTPVPSICGATLLWSTAEKNVATTNGKGEIQKH